MRNELYRNARTVACTLFVVTCTLVVAAAGMLAAGPLSADPLNRLSADFQIGEISTNAVPPGILVYTKAVSRFSPSGVPFNTLYVTFSGQGDTHNGSALLTTATVDGNFCEPLADSGFGGGGPHVFPHWYTLNILPQPTVVTNCNDGGGGSADCHDNTIYFSCCARLAPCNIDSGKCTNPVVNIRLADLPGGGANVAFYERSTIYIDAENDAKHEHCTLNGGSDGG